jgi:hypothetical protein
MNPRRRVFGEVAKRDHTTVSGIDVAALLRRLILFDEVIIRSVRLRELPFLVRTFGKSGILTAFESGVLRLSCEFTSLIEGLERNGVSHTPPDHFSFGIVDVADRERVLQSEFTALQSVSGLKNAQRSASEEAAWKALVRPGNSFGADLQLQVEHDLRTNPSTLRASLLHVLRGEGICGAAATSHLHLSVEENSPKIFRIRHNLAEAFGIPIEQSRRFVARAVSGANGLNCRLAEMAAYSAITGFSDDEAPLLFGKLSGIIEALNPTSKENQFSRVAAIADVGEPTPGSRIDFERLLEIRNSDECRAFKAWLDDADSLTDEDLIKELAGIRSKLGLWASNPEGRMLRFAAITGIGLLPGGTIPATMLGFADSFIVEKLIPKSGIVSFLRIQYPSVFDR